MCCLPSSCSHPDNTQIIHEHREREGQGGSGAQAEVETLKPPHFLTFMYEKHSVAGRGEKESLIGRNTLNHVKVMHLDVRFFFFFLLPVEPGLRRLKAFHWLEGATGGAAVCHEV